jgi:hypothetical protein
MRAGADNVNVPLRHGEILDLITAVSALEAYADTTAEEKMRLAALQDRLRHAATASHMRACAAATEAALRED